MRIGNFKVKFVLNENESNLKIYYYRAVKGSTVKSPEVVKEFLNILNDNLQPKATQDFQEMQKMKNTESRIKQVCILYDIYNTYLYFIYVINRININKYCRIQ